MADGELQMFAVAMEYEPLPEVKPIASAYKGKGPATKRKRDEIEDDGLDVDMDDEELPRFDFDTSKAGPLP